MLNAQIHRIADAKGARIGYTGSGQESLVGLSQLGQGTFPWASPQQTEIPTPVS
jgi:hypothetical protein